MSYNVSKIGLNLMSSSFTTRIDSGLKLRLEKIAKLEDRSASYIANQAIRALVEDREYSHRLVEIGKEQIAEGVSISEERMDAWVEAWAKGEDRPFPKAEKI